MTLHLKTTFSRLLTKVDSRKRQPVDQSSGILLHQPVSQICTVKIKVDILITFRIKFNSTEKILQPRCFSNNNITFLIKKTTIFCNFMMAPLQFRKTHNFLCYVY